MEDTCNHDDFDIVDYDGLDLVLLCLDCQAEGHVTAITPRADIDWS